MLESCEPVRIPIGQQPLLIPVVDTEEEFDWSGGFDRSATGVSAIRNIRLFQDLCDEFRIRPTYVIDYPVATTPESIGVLRPIIEEGRAVVGAHLHPWVNPPHEEEVSERSSFPGNLPPELEAAKIRALSDAILSRFGTRPTIYKAGRHGLGPNTGRILEEQGFDIDLSIHAGADLRAAGGPDFSAYPPRPVWFGRARRLLEIPVTSAWVGPLAAARTTLHAWADRPALRPLRLRALLSRLRAIERLRLSPEDMGHPEHRRLVRSLLRRGCRVFTFTFHSPSLKPGCTPYVRNERDLQSFLGTCRAFFDYFLGEIGGAASTPSEVRQLLGESHLKEATPSRGS